MITGLMAIGAAFKAVLAIIVTYAVIGAGIRVGMVTADAVISKATQAREQNKASKILKEWMAGVKTPKFLKPKIFQRTPNATVAPA